MTAWRKKKDAPVRPLILIVEDEEPVRQTARRILETADYEVLEAENGLKGIAALEANARVDLLVADIDMPELTGDEMVRRVRARHPHLKVLYVSGHVDRLFEQRQCLWEDEAFLDKPFTPGGLLEAVSLLLYGTIQPQR